MQRRKFSSASAAFSLLEILIVTALAGSLLMLAMVAYSSFAQAAALTTAAEMVGNALTEARQTAMTQNTNVEVRIYDLPAVPNAPGAYGSLQLHQLKPDGTTPALQKVLLLPTSVVIDATAAHSPLLASNKETATPDKGDPCLDSATRVFHFLPDGSTDLNPANSWFLTLRIATHSDPAHFPANWACVEIDPATGRVQIYRP